MLDVWNWIKDHPESAIEALVAMWAVANVIWAQWPKPHSETGQRVWKTLHVVFGLITTHASAKGTFTWPGFVRGLVERASGVGSPDPFHPAADSKQEKK